MPPPSAAEGCAMGGGSLPSLRHGSSRLPVACVSVTCRFGGLRRIAGPLSCPHGLLLRTPTATIEWPGMDLWR